MAASTLNKPSSFMTASRRQRGSRFLFVGPSVCRSISIMSVSPLKPKATQCDGLTGFAKQSRRLPFCSCRCSAPTPKVVPTRPRCGSILAAKSDSFPPLNSSLIPRPRQSRFRKMCLTVGPCGTAQFRCSISFAGRDYLPVRWRQPTAVATVAADQRRR
jgi:hypothetical protein